MTQTTAADGALPCPGCSYDLRGQVTPACPECGQSFPSLDALRLASQTASRVFLRVLRWRQWIAIGILGGIWGGFLMPMGFSRTGTAPGNILSIAGILFLLIAVIASASALVLLIQVVRWRFSKLIPLPQRRELTGSIPLLAFFGLPALLALWFGGIAMLVVGVRLIL